MKFGKLILEDFQAHERLEITFTPGITTIKGPTDTGKSAILRALRILCCNDLPGGHFVRDGAKRFKITLIGVAKKERHTVTRSRNKDGAVNTYELDEKEFKSFGQSVPPDVASFLRVSAINFQDQHDSPFWFKETGGEVSRQLNSVVDLSIIDATLGKIAGMARGAGERVKATEERLSDAEFKLNEIQDSRKRIDDFKELTALHKASGALGAALSGLENLVASVQKTTTQAASCARQADAGEVVLVAIGRARRLSGEVDDLDDLIKSIKQLNRDLENAPPPLTAIEKEYNKWQGLLEEMAELQSLMKKIKVQSDLVAEWDAEHANRHRAFTAQTKGRNCPLCKKPL